MGIDDLAAMRGNGLFGQLHTTDGAYDRIELALDHRERCARMQ
jgi:hypothetical protein